VVSDISSHVGEVNAEAYHRRLMTYCVDVGDDLGYRSLVVEVAPVVPRAWIEILRDVFVRGRVERIDDGDLVSAACEEFDDVRPDEPGTAGHEHPHQLGTRGRRSVKHAPPLSFTTVSSPW